MTSVRRRRPVAGSSVRAADPATERLRFRATLIAEIPRLRRYATAWLGSAAAADGLVQDVIERIIAQGDASDEPQRLRIRLLRLMHDLHEGSAGRPRHDGPIGLHGLSADLPPPDARGQRARRPELIGAIARLSDEHRRAWLLVALEGFAYREAADVLGLPLGTLMSRLAGAREEVLTLTGGSNPEGPAQSDSAFAATRSGVSELDLHAYLDGELGAARVETVKAVLQSHPERAERLERFTAREERLRKWYEPLLHRPLPPELLALLVATPAQPVEPPRSRLATAIAAVGLLLLGVVAGWLLRSHFTPAGIVVPWLGS